MSTGPQMDKMRKELVDWWLSTRQRLIAAMEEGYPYRSTKMTTDEQIDTFVNMQDTDWITLVDRLKARFKGEPNQEELIRNELQRYQERMYKLMGSR